MINLNIFCALRYNSGKMSIRTLNQDKLNVLNKYVLSLLVTISKQNSQKCICWGNCNLQLCVTVT
jgi:hypothetical protein